MKLQVFLEIKTFMCQQLMKQLMESFRFPPTVSTVLSKCIEDESETNVKNFSFNFLVFTPQHNKQHRGFHLFY